ncbi:MAG: glucose-1-phosphate adenylyltransferase [Clostridiaceae bacterium]
MRKKEMAAMILAGGQGARLKELTKDICKPAIPFAGKYRIIDFTLSNCTHSGIDTVGVLTQYRPITLHTHIGVGIPWDLDRNFGGVHLLSPFMTEKGGNWYSGTANAIYENIEFLDHYDPEYLLVLSGDHIYKMDYSIMLQYHKDMGADATIAVIEVPEEDVSRFGILSTNEDGSIYEFTEKPEKSESRLASMGVYIFTWKKMRELLEEDNEDKSSEHDFGKNIIPKMLESKDKLYAYAFNGYWKDVGTVESYWEANLDLIKDYSSLNLYENEWRIFSKSNVNPPQYIGKDARIAHSIISDGCIIQGDVYNSVLFPNVCIGKNAKVMNSVVMANVKIEENVIIDKAVIGNDSIIRKNTVVGNSEDIALIGAGREIKTNGFKGV